MSRAGLEPTVTIVDTEIDVCRSLAILARQLGLSAAPFTSPLEFLERFDPGAPGCVVVDLGLPQKTGLEILRDLRQAGAKTPCILMSGQADIPTAVKAMKLGAFDFLEKPFAVERIRTSIHEAIAFDLESRQRHGADADFLRRVNQLTDAERRVMQLVVEGKPDGQIAEDLDISRRTVYTRRTSLMGKLQVQTRMELVHLALAHRELVPLMRRRRGAQDAAQR
jgi:two-component system response regulator FixJ